MFLTVFCKRSKKKCFRVSCVCWAKIIILRFGVFLWRYPSSQFGSKVEIMGGENHEIWGSNFCFKELCF